MEKKAIRMEMKKSKAQVAKSCTHLAFDSISQCSPGDRKLRKCVSTQQQGRERAGSWEVQGLFFHSLVYFIWLPFWSDQKVKFWVSQPFLEVEDERYRVLISYNWVFLISYEISWIHKQKITKGQTYFRSDQKNFQDFVSNFLDIFQLCLMAWMVTPLNTLNTTVRVHLSRLSWKERSSCWPWRGTLLHYEGPCGRVCGQLTNRQEPSADSQQENGSLSPAASTDWFWVSF